MQITVYQRYERGEREFLLWAAIKLADYYGITLDYLAGREAKYTKINNKRIGHVILEKSPVMCPNIFNICFCLF